MVFGQATALAVPPGAAKNVASAAEVKRSANSVHYEGACCFCAGKTMLRD
jgi:hypothetical protein